MHASQDFSIEIKDDTCFLEGELGAGAQLKTLLDAPRPLRLNLKNLRQINSIGVRDLCLFFKENKIGKFKYIECQPNYLDLLNMVPLLLKGEGFEGSIESLYLPYACSVCAHEQNVLTDISEIKIEKKHVEIKSFSCSGCNGDNTLEPALPPEDLLYVLIS